MCICTYIDIDMCQYHGCCHGYKTRTRQCRTHTHTHTHTSVSPVLARLQDPHASVRRAAAEALSSLSETGDKRVLDSVAKVFNRMCSL